MTAGTSWTLPQAPGEMAGRAASQAWRGGDAVADPNSLKPRSRATGEGRLRLLVWEASSLNAPRTMKICEEGSHWPQEGAQLPARPEGGIGRGEEGW